MHCIDCPKCKQREEEGYYKHNYSERMGNRFMTLIVQYVKNGTTNTETTLR